MLERFQGKKTILGSLALCLLGAVGSLDVLVNGSPTWLSPAQYVALGAIVEGFTKVAMRVGLKSEVEKAINSK